MNLVKIAVISGAAALALSLTACDEQDSRQGEAASAAGNSVESVTNPASQVTPAESGYAASESEYNNPLLPGSGRLPEFSVNGEFSNDGTREMDARFPSEAEAVAAAKSVCKMAEGVGSLLELFGLISSTYGLADVLESAERGETSDAQVLLIIAGGNFCPETVMRPELLDDEIIARGIEIQNQDTEN